MNLTTPFDAARTQRSAPVVADDTVVYAVTDVHGRADLLEQVLETIRAKAGETSARTQRLICLGDYIDRGPDSAGVIERLLNGAPDGFDVTCLKGNHEAILLALLDAPRPDAASFMHWFGNGGDATCRSYGLDPEELTRGGTDAPGFAVRLRAQMPDAHLAFLRGLALTAESGDYYFCHAGVRPGVALDAQAPHDLMWIRDAFHDHDGDFGKIVVHGHTPVEEPEVRPNRINLDTGAWFSGCLTALRLDGAARRFIPTR